jgi:glyoxylase-like metal-dependent hydrolase (beta-lactamase superfamily II)
MRKKTFTLFAVIFALFLLLALTAAGFLLRVRRELSSFSVQPTGAVNHEIYAIQDGTVNFYLLEKNGKHLAVDAGNSARNAKKLMAASGISPGDVAAVLLTHTDYDHTAALSLFSNAEIFISASEENMLNGKTHRVLFFDNRLDAAHQLLKDGELLDIAGWDVKTIVIPGHTAGSACFLIDGKYLFTGDTGLSDGRVTPFNEFFCVDRDEQAVSLKKLDGLRNVEIVLTAHYGISRDYKNF